MVDSVRTERADRAVVGLTTPIHPDESDAAAEEPFMDVVRDLEESLPRFIPLE